MPWRRVAYPFLLLFAIGFSGKSENAHGEQVQWQPRETIEFIVGTAPSGIFDHTARLVQAILREKKIVNLPIIVINKPGGFETISTAYLNRHAGDGHYLQVTSGNILSNYLLGKNPVNYTDVTPIAMLFTEATAIAVKADSPINSASDLVTRLRQDPQALSFAVGSALGTVPHVAVSLIMKAAGGNVRALTIVTYRSSGESVTALLGGHVDVIAASVTLVNPYIKAGKLRMIGIASVRRLTGTLAEVPTLKEQGVDAVVTNFRGVFGPGNLGRAPVAYWEQVLYTVTQTAEWRKQQETNLWEDSFARSEAFTRFLEVESAKTKMILSELELVK